MVVASLRVQAGHVLVFWLGRVPEPAGGVVRIPTFRDDHKKQTEAKMKIPVAYLWFMLNTKQQQATCREEVGVMSIDVHSMSS